MAANSKFDLCSQAYRLLGLGSINSFTGGGKEAIAGELYDTIVMSLIEGYPWHFTRVISAALNRLTETPAANWTYFYQLPNNLEGIVWALYDTAAIDAAPFKHWERMGQKIATNATAIYIHYAALPEVGQMPRYFHNLAVHALAAAFAQPAKESAELAEHYRSIAFGTPEQNGKGGLWAVATSADSRGSPSSVQRDNPFIDCR